MKSSLGKNGGNWFLSEKENDKKNLNRITILIILFLLAFGLRIGHRIIFYDLSYDKTRQISASGNYIKNNGISDCTVTANNLAEITCKPQTWWASGYPVLLSWLNYFTKDFIISDYILIGLGFLILFLSAYFIFESINYSLTIVSPFHLFLLFSAFSFAPYHYLSTADLLSFAFFVAGCAASLYIIKGVYFSASILTGLLFFSSGFIKYNFYPFLIIIPIALFIVFLLTRKRQLIYSIIIYTITVLIGFCLLWILFPNNLTNQESKNFPTGWNWKHLLEFDVFPLKAFFFLDPFLLRLESYYWLEFIARLGLFTISFIFVLSFLIYAFNNLRKVYYKKIINLENYVYLLGSITLIINIGFLTWLSLRLAEFPQVGNPNWTFVWETRYYIPTMFFFQVYLFSLPFKIDLSVKKLKGIIGILAIIPIVFAITYWSWKHFDIFINKRLDGTYYAESADKVKIGNFLRDNLHKETQPSVLTFLNYGEGYGANRIINHNAKGYGATRLDWDFSVSEKLNTSRSITLFFVLPRELSSLEGEFVKVNNATIVLELSKSNLYRMEVEP
ncbi:MAG: hypothetical protein M3R14_07130 [Acidobacteriota bacterium]|nr:hypothetical protein [Acidobacteriota bacterium]